MLAKMTSKNQITLPKAVTKDLGDVEYFEVRAEAGSIVLTPVRLNRADAVRSQLAAMGITEKDVTDAVKWARKGR
jgi:bifunctional DNA-binding transcriptional regulator/antitoxin component of YhaV-PrlF toxin-antitoxin module